MHGKLWVMWMKILHSALSYVPRSVFPNNCSFFKGKYGNRVESMAPLFPSPLLFVEEKGLHWESLLSM